MTGSEYITILQDLTHLMCTSIYFVVAFHIIQEAYDRLRGHHEVRSLIGPLPLNLLHVLIPIHLYLLLFRPLPNPFELEPTIVLLHVGVFGIMLEAKRRGYENSSLHMAFRLAYTALWMSKFVVERSSIEPVLGGWKWMLAPGQWELTVCCIPEGRCLWHGIVGGRYVGIY